MPCIFCKSDQNPSKSVEHILPESLGNTRNVLPRGLVCDVCNNYFARKVERPLLEHPSFRNLRAFFGIPNKRGISPSFSGFIAGTDLEVALRAGRGSVEMSAERSSESQALQQHFTEHAHGGLIIPVQMPSDTPLPEVLMSRLLAKMALEFAAPRFAKDPEQMQRFLHEDYFGRLRRWARYGDGFDKWPFSSRQIFQEDTLMRHPNTGAWVPAGYSMDLVPTRRPETYFAICLYGHEYVINVGGPSIKGFEDWLKRHNGISPLVERLGWRVVTNEPSAPRARCLVGKQDPTAGMAFDRELEGFQGYGEAS